MSVAFFTQLTKFQLRQSSCGYRRFLHKSSMQFSDNVLFSEIGTTGVVTLNRPKVLNTLNLEMLHLIHTKLKEWQSNSKISQVLVEGSGDTAFCAGGDVVTMANLVKNQSNLTNWISKAYRLINLMGTLGKPCIALITGITMGGGVGLSVHMPFRVASEKTVFAMPEIVIGYFPDVGGGYFLPRLRGHMGTYLALTGMRLKGRDVQKIGVATHFVDHAQLDDLKTAIIGLHNASLSELQSVLNNFQAASTLLNPSTPSDLAPHLEDIDRHFSFDTIEKILHNLETKDPCEWSKKQAAVIRRMSPTSLKITLRQMLEGAQMSSLAECLAMEYRMAVRCSNDHDSYEGVRALLLDKDNSPKWSPHKLSEVTQENVDSYFAPLQNTPDLNFD